MIDDCVVVVGVVYRIQSDLTTSKTRWNVLVTLSIGPYGRSKSCRPDLRGTIELLAIGPDAPAPHLHILLRSRRQQLYREPGLERATDTHHIPQT
jgi:hypothetical protein